MVEFSPVEVCDNDIDLNDDDDEDDQNRPPSASDQDNLSMLQATALLTADCLGTGLLALPQDIQVLGWFVGLGFLVANLPINWYAGKLLSNAALEVERRHEEEKQSRTNDIIEVTELDDGNFVSVVVKAEPIDTSSVEPEQQANPQQQEENPTHDYVCISRAIFQSPPRLVALVYYINIFLVLGDYILVQSHAVAAMLGEGSICLPTAGLIASTLMFGLSQLRTMAKLGHTVTAISLLCLLVVVLQCLIAGERKEPADVAPPSTVLQKLSALASIGFATGSNKLILNIRNEMKDKREAPRTVAISSTVYGSVYVVICLFAGPSKSLVACYITSQSPISVVTYSPTPFFFFFRPTILFI